MKVIQIDRGAVCVKFENGNKEVSIAADNSCGAFTDMQRCSMRLYVGNKNVTKEVFNVEDVYNVDESMQKAFQWLYKE